MRILVADDERIMRRSLQRKLEGWGHSVAPAENGQEAWTLFQEQSFDMILTDWEMPVMDGRELVKRIRGFDRDSYAYVIMLTSRAEKEDVVRGMQAGADDFLTKPFDSNELKVRLAAGQRIIELERSLAARNHDLERANVRMKRDMEAAARIQKSLLPHDIPQIPGLKIAWRYLPCDQLAGDALNVFALDEDNLVFYLSDVTGHGVPASLLSFSLAHSLAPSSDPHSVLQSSSQGDLNASPAQVASRLNKLFPMESNGNLFFTLHFGILHCPSMRYTYTSAGHPGPILLPKGEKADSHDLYCLPIGVMEVSDYEEKTIQLRPGDRLYIHSDGVNEERNEESEPFGRERLRQCLGEYRALPLEKGVDLLVESLEQWNPDAEFEDDVSLIAFELS